MALKDGSYIKMVASMAGAHFSFAPDQVLIVGTHIDGNMAQALVDEPADYPRAVKLSDEDGAREYAAQQQPDPDKPEVVHEVPPGEQFERQAPPEPEPEPEKEEAVAEERSDEQATSTPKDGVERATDPGAETRETTAAGPGRRKRVKPPADAPKDDKS